MPASNMQEEVTAFFFSRLKAEHPGDGMFKSLEDALTKVLEYIRQQYNDVIVPVLSLPGSAAAVCAHT